MPAEPVRVQAHARRTVGRLAPWLLALLCAAILSPFVLAESLALNAAEFQVGEPSAITLRVNALRASPLGADGGAIAIARGATVDARGAAFAKAKRRGLAGRWIAVFATLFVAFLIWSRVLRQDHRGRLLRVQLVTLGLVILLVALSSLALLFTSVSILAIPVSLVAVLVGRRAHRPVAVASAALCALIVATLVPFDLGIALVLGLQAVLPAMVTPRHASLARMAAVAGIGALATTLAYALAYYAAFGLVPGFDGASGSTWLAAAIGAPLGTALAQPLRPLYSWLCGDVSSPTLSRLERLSQPLLKQIADKSPGTWQHSLAMASLGQAAGRSVGADLQLLRVGAYYHDLGKSLQPKYFIENLEGGETSVHDKLSAQASRDGIFAHVSEGVAAAREAGLPERVIDFIVSHHGGGTLEYFWAKQSLDESNTEQAASFCYPGNRPQCPETGIMCICDAVEGAARGLKSPSRVDIENIVDHIVFGKMRMGQLAECGLSLANLLRIRDALCQALLAAHAPVQHKAKGADAISTANARPAGLLEPTASPMASLHAIRLDSLDRPSASWSAEMAASASGPRHSADMALAETESIEDGMALDTTDKLVAQVVTLSSAEMVGTAAVEPKADEAAGARDMSSQLESVQKMLGVATKGKAAAPASTEALTASIGRPSDNITIPREDRPEEVLLLKRPRATAEIVKPTPNPTPNPTPPPPPAKRFTIPLGEGEPSVRPAQASHRADSQDGLRPGEMVVGAPPATHPERGQKRDRSPEEVTVMRPIPLPSEARRPEDRITEEQLALIPPEAYGEDTIPRTSRPGSDSDDPESGF